MKYISLFAGIGGFDLALNRLGHECVWASEWDKYAAQIYDKNFGHQESGESLQGTERGSIQYRGDKPNIEVRGNSQPKTWGDRKFQQSKGIDTRDIRTVPTSDIPDHDILVGGFPCQAFSIAGKRRGFDDTRGTLFFEIARILKAKHPTYFILENVKGLLSHDNGFTFKTIISTLTELGYDLQWQVLNSKNFRVPQNRERVFIVGHIRGQPRPKVFPITASSGQTDELQGLKVGAITARRGMAKSDGDYIVESNRETQKVAFATNTKKGYDLAEEKNDGIRLEHPKSKTARGRVVKGASQALKTSAQVGVLDKMRIRRLTPKECERLQGFPDGWTEGVSDTQRYKCLGNAVTVNVVYEVARRL